MITTNKGCSFPTNEAVIDKIRAIGKADTPIDNSLQFTCNCGEAITMTSYVYNCPKCLTVYGVTPCSADDVNNVISAPKGY